ncbi:hypothetical protein I6B53_00920 [Schaalia sp. 19OD2882]|uniref:SdrD B-like domain-containing protein n=1 Tax=Schaalia sp. 19OD2882 TaxID=2794089 RepID=UPI001C1F0610|nr:SdrD B-like domain-containing protein [Schaalia sp. 19OD2882]QWW19733.1 hypothetical protein I6B53_00920 [Schaalia sp. 19OD2882]
MRVSAPPQGAAPRTWTGASLRAVLVAVLAVAGLVAPAQVIPAQAAPNPAIKITNATLLTADESSVNPIYYQNGAVLTFNWDASAANPKVGDSFGVGFDPVFNALTTQTIEMKANTAGGEKKVGSCVVSKTGMVCTFDDGLQAAIDAGHGNQIKGAGKVKLSNVQTTNSTTVPLNLNGTITQVPLPGNKPIGPEPYYAWGFTKDLNTIKNVGEVDKNWQIQFSSNYMEGKMPGFTTDGTVSTLVLRDVLGEGQTLNIADGATVKLSTFTTGAQGVPARTLLLDGTGAKHAFANGWTLKTTQADGNHVDITITGTWPKDTNFFITVPITFDGGAKAGVKYQNSAFIGATDHKAYAEEWYTEAAEITVSMQPGFGTFKVGKFVQGDAAAHVAAESTFTLDVKFVLPKNYDQYNPHWTPPAGYTMDADGKTFRGKMKVILGKNTYFDPLITLPMNTVVNLAEDPAAQAQQPGVTWGTPKFNVTAFQIADRKVNAIQLTNTAERSAGAVRVGDYVWIDKDRNGLQDATDVPIANAKLTLSRSDKTTVNNADGTPRAQLTATTDAQGLYRFDALETLPAGVHYVVTIDPTSIPAGLEPTETKNGGTGPNDSSAQAGFAESVDLVNDGEEDLTLDFGYVELVPGIDIEKYDGAWDGVEFINGVPSLSGDGQPAKLPQNDRDTAADALLVGAQGATVKFTVTNTGKADLKKVSVTDSTTAGDALTNITCTVAGAQVAGDAIDAEWVFKSGTSFECTGTLPSITQAHADTAKVQATPVYGGQPVTDEDSWHASPNPKVSVGDYVWEDVNKDGLQDATDKPIAGVTLTLSRSDNAPVKNWDGTARTELTTTTDDSGKYAFKDLEALPQGIHYVVAVTTPQGFQPTTPDRAGGDRSVDSDAIAGKAESTDLTDDGANDPTLDFGFVKRVPGIDIEKYDGTWDGVAFDGVGRAALDGNGQPATLPVGDRDTAADALVLKEGAQATVTFTVTNTGNEDLKKVRVTDSTTQGAALVDVMCTVAGAQVAGDAIDPEWLFKPGTSFDCTGTLQAIGEAHADKASVQATPAAGGEPVTDEDEWHAKPFPKVAVGDYVWEDVNRDGLQDATDRPIEGVVLEISRTDSQPVNDPDGTARKELTATTDASGKYLFENLQVLPQGVHYVVTVKTGPKAMVPTIERDDDDRALDSDAKSGKAESTDLLVDGAKDLTLDFGYHIEKPGVDIEKFDGSWDGVGFVNGEAKLTNGQPADLPAGDRDTAETALVVKGDAEQPVTFTVTNTGLEDLTKVVVSDATTNGPALAGVVCTVNGTAYEADASGVVTIDPAWVFVPQASFSCTGTLPALGEVKLHSDTASVEAVTVASGMAVSDKDDWHAKPRPKVKVGNYVWFDQNKNGVQDDGEPGIEGVELTLTDEAGNPVTNVFDVPVAPVVTDGQGYYEFPNLPAGKKYVVTVTKAPSGYEPTKAGATDRDKDSSTGKEISVLLPGDGDEDMTLDFGFVKPEVPPTTPGTPKLPVTGAATGMTLVGAVVALAVGALAVGLRRRRA